MKKSIIDNTITNAVLSQVLKKTAWFEDMEWSIDKTINSHPKWAEYIIKVWLRRCDELHATKCREWIVEHYKITNVPRGT